MDCMKCGPWDLERTPFPYEPSFVRACGPSSVQACAHFWAASGFAMAGLLVGWARGLAQHLFRVKEKTLRYYKILRHREGSVGRLQFCNEPLSYAFRIECRCFLTISCKRRLYHMCMCKKSFCRNTCARARTKKKKRAKKMGEENMTKKTERRADDDS